MWKLRIGSHLRQNAQRVLYRPLAWLLSCLKSAYPESMPEPRYRPQKFDELVVYIASKTADDEKCGDKKFNKLLYFSDATAYRRTGKPITGAKYQHEEHGPIARAFLKARRSLVGKRVKTVERKYYGFDQTGTVAIDEPNLSVFEPGELEIVDEVIERFKGLDGKEMEQIAHQEPGWQMTGDHEQMPYREMLLVKRASPRAIERGKELAERFGW